MEQSTREQNQYTLTEVDKKILDIIQTKFPIKPKPYQCLAEQVGISEQEAFECVQNLKKNGIIRRLGANFQSHKLGFHSTLCAAKVPTEKMKDFIDLVNSHAGVTHNYLRKHDYNIWFTLIAPSKDLAIKTLANISKNTGIEILNLPAKKLYKIRVDFAMQDK